MVNFLEVKLCVIFVFCLCPPAHPRQFPKDFSIELVFEPCSIDAILHRINNASPPKSQATTSKKAENPTTTTTAINSSAASDNSNTAGSKDKMKHTLQLLKVTVKTALLNREGEHSQKWFYTMLPLVKRLRQTLGGHLGTNLQ